MSDGCCRKVFSGIVNFIVASLRFIIFIVSTIGELLIDLARYIVRRVVFKDDDREYTLDHDDKNFYKRDLLLCMQAIDDYGKLKERV